MNLPDPGEAHCADHVPFRSECAVCQRARANFEPYPIDKSKPVARSFGFEDDLTEEKLRALNPKLGNLFKDEAEFSWSLSVLRVLRRLIWPF